MRRIIIAVVAAVALLGLTPGIAAAGDGKTTTARSSSRVTGPDSADTATAGGVCGSSYWLVAHYPIYQPGTSYVNAYLDVYYNGYRNCAVNMATSRTWGVRMYRTVYIGLSSSAGWDDYDRGYFSYYAGPAYSKPSAGKCIDVAAGLDDGLRGYTAKNRVLCG